MLHDVKKADMHANEWLPKYILFHRADLVLWKVQCHMCEWIAATDCDACHNFDWLNFSFFHNVIGHWYCAMTVFMPCFIDFIGWKTCLARTKMFSTFLIGWLFVHIYTKSFSVIQNLLLTMFIKTVLCDWQPFRIRFFHYETYVCSTTFWLP